MLIDLLMLLGLIGARQAPDTPATLTADPKGWMDLLADASLKQWSRVPLGAVGQLPAGDVTATSPWKLDPSGILVCEGDKTGHEMFRFAQETGDFVLHVEWRFTRLEGDRPYNSGVFARTTADGGIWHQAQSGPGGGYLFGNTLAGGSPQRFNLRDKMVENRVKPAGEWNAYEIRAVGRTMSLWVNGAVVSQFDQCDVPRGHVGLEAEGYRIEFRNVKLKLLPAGAKD